MNNLYLRQQKCNKINILPSLLPSFDLDVLVKQPIYKGFDNEI